MKLQVISIGNIVTVIYHMIAEKTFNIYHASFNHKINGQAIDGEITSKDKKEII